MGIGERGMPNSIHGIKVRNHAPERYIQHPKWVLCIEISLGIQSRDFRANQTSYELVSSMSLHLTTYFIFQLLPGLDE